MHSTGRRNKFTHTPYKLIVRLKGVSSSSKTPLSPFGLWSDHYIVGIIGERARRLYLLYLLYLFDLIDLTYLTYKYYLFYLIEWVSQEGKG